MSKKITAGKLIGIIFCILSAVVMCVLFVYNIYLGGQMKLISKYFTAIERDDFDGYTACFVSSIAEQLDENDFMNEKNALAEKIKDNEKFKTSVTFDDRKKIGKGRYSITFDLTVYNDIEHFKLENVSMVLIRNGGKWFLETEI